MLKYRQISRVALIIIFCVAIILGLALGAILQPLNPWWLITAVTLLLCRRRQLLLAIPIVLLVGVIIGWWRGASVMADINNLQAKVGQNVIVQGVLADDPTYSQPQYDMFLTQVTVNGSQTPGKIRVKTISYAGMRRGDKIEASGKLYSGFGSYQAMLTYAKVKIIDRTQDPTDWLRRQFAASVRNVLPDTSANLGLGFLLGVSSQLPPDLNSQLKSLGLTHIVVASGYNLTVLVQLAQRLLARRSHLQMTMLSLLLVIGFVAITGLSPSMSRAALISGLSITAWFYGRRAHPAMLIAFTAAVTAVIQPLYIWSDLGWWLSFLAFTGVLLIAPLVQKRFLNNRRPKIIGQVILETLCAEVLTLPLMLTIFGTLPVLSLIANILIVPLIPLAMLFTFVAGAIGWLVPFVAWPAALLLGFIQQAVSLLAQVPWALQKVNLPVPAMIGIYAGMILMYLIMLRRTQFNYLKNMVK